MLTLKQQIKTKRKTKVKSKVKPENKTKKPNGKKILLIIICIFVSLVLVFGITLGIILAVKSSRAFLSYEGITVNEGECRFLASCYKYSFIDEYADRGAYDSPEFWASEYDGNTTYGELLKKNTEEYIKKILAANYLFDSFLEFEKSDKTNVLDAVNEVLDYKAEGDEEKFNSLTEKYGFTFDDFESAAILLYKAQSAMVRIFGEDGSNMRTFYEECNEYFETYSHVKLLFIRTENKFLLDENGDRVRDENNEDTLIDLSDGEKAARMALLSEIRAAITALNENSDEPQMTSTYFNALLSEHDEGDKNKRSSGYYFSPESSYTKEFASAYPDIVKRSLEMELDSYSEIDFDGGVCFIYKYENTSGAYNDTSDESCFLDFYELAAEHTFYAAIDEIVAEINVSDKFSSIDVLEMPYNYNFIPRF